MSSTGNCYDNAVVESFFGGLKRERVNRVRYRTGEEVRADLFKSIEVRVIDVFIDRYPQLLL